MAQDPAAPVRGAPGSHLQGPGATEVARLTGLSKVTIPGRYRDGTFPRPLKLGAQSIGWRREEIVAWVESLRRVGAARDHLKEADQEVG